MKKIPDADFIAAWEAGRRSPSAVAQILNIDPRSVVRRRNSLAKKGIVLNTIDAANRRDIYGWRDIGRAYKRQIDYSIDTGSIIVFSDAHWWPDQPMSAAHSALLTLIAELKPQAIVANGDVFDGARVSRHAPQFEYAENNPSPHCAGFAVLSFKDGLLLPPELCEVINGNAYFRGQQV